MKSVADWVGSLLSFGILLLLGAGFFGGMRALENHWSETDRLRRDVDSLQEQLTEAQADIQEARLTLISAGIHDDGTDGVGNHFSSLPGRIGSLEFHDRILDMRVDSCDERLRMASMRDYEHSQQIISHFTTSP